MAALIAVTAFGVVTATPVQAAGNGIETGEFLYVVQTDTGLADACSADQPPEFVVLNIGNGHTDDVGRLDTIAQTCRTNGTKVLGYVHLVDSLDYDGDSNTTELRPRTGGSGGIAVGSDLEFWINPLSNTERSNASQYLDGIFLDQMPSTCGTSSANVTHIADITDAVQDKFTFWGYGDAVVMGNAGTAIADCIPGYALAPYNVDMPDRYVTFEGTYATYAASYLGGNVTNGSSYYNGENTFGQDKFVHIVYDADASEAETALRLADDRGAGWLAATDDSGGNPYDTRATYADDSTRLAATPRVIFDEGQQGVSFFYDSGTPFAASIELDNNVDGGDSVFVDRFEALILQECYVDISAGTVGTPGDAGAVGSATDTYGINTGHVGWDLSYSSLNSGFLDCVRNATQPGSNPNDHGLTICNDIVNLGGGSYSTTDYDCLATDGDITTENVNEAATSFMQSLFDTNAEVAEWIVLVRDRNVENANAGTAAWNCENVALLRCLQPTNPPPGGLGQYREPDIIFARPGWAPGIAVTGFEFGWQTFSVGGSNP